MATTKKAAAPKTLANANTLVKSALLDKALDAPKRAAKPEAKKAIEVGTPPTVVAKGKRGFAALAEGVPGLRNAAPATKPAAKKSALAKHDEAKAKITRSRTDPSLPGVPVTKVRTLGQLREALLDFPSGNTFTTGSKFGIDLLHIQNARGRTVGQFQVEVKKPAAPKKKK